MKNLETFASILSGFGYIDNKNLTNFYLENLGKKALKEIAKELKIKNPKITIDKPLSKVLLYENDTRIMELDEKSLEIYNKKIELKKLIDIQSFINKIKDEKYEIEKFPIFRMTVVFASFHSRFSKKTAQKEYVNKIEEVIFVDIPLLNEIDEINNEHAKMFYQLTTSIYDEYMFSQNSPKAKIYKQNKMKEIKARLFISKNKEEFAKKLENKIIKSHKPIIRKLEERNFFFGSKIEDYIKERVLTSSYLQNALIEDKKTPEILEINGWIETTDFYEGKTKTSGSLFYELYPTGIVMIAYKKLQKLLSKQIKEKQTLLFV